MQTPSRTELVTYVIALIFVAGVHILPWMADACEQTAWKGIMAVSGPSCTEFWINRYQTAWAGLIGASVALAAAWIAWHSIQIQITRDGRAARDQARQQRNFQMQRLRQEIETLAAFKERIRSFSEEMKNLPTDTNFAPVRAFVRSTPPSSIGLAMLQQSKASNDYAIWAQKLAEARSLAQMHLNNLPAGPSANAVARAWLNDFWKQIPSEIERGSQLTRQATLEIEQKEQMIAALSADNFEQ